MAGVIVISAVLALCAIAKADSKLVIERASDGITIRRGDAIVRLQVWHDRIVRVQSTTSAKLSPPTVTAVVAKPGQGKFEAIDMPGYVGVKTPAVEARVDRTTLAVSFIDGSTGKTFLAEAGDGRSVTTTKVGEQTIQGPVQTFLRQPGEAIIGLGQPQSGQFNYTKTRVRLQQQNTIIGVPVLTSSAGYTLLWDNAAVTDITTDQSTVKWASEFGDSVDYYVCYGPDLNQAIAGYRDLTGAAPMFGRWAWGLWQCRERYVKQEDLLDVAREYRKRQIPIDGIIQDWQYWFPQPWGSHAFGTNFPDPSAAVKELHDAHFHTLISVWPKFDQGSKNYDEMDAAGNLYPPIYPNVAPKGRAKWYDPFKPQAREMYWRQMNEQIGVHGWDGWWLDATEPELGGKWGELRNLQTATGPGYAVFNAYPLMTTTAVYEGQRARKPEVRPLILTRSAYAGQQRNGAIAWSGDIRGTWDVFKKQIPAGLNFVATGMPYWNTDTGGFFSGDPDDPEYRELFTRWFQFSTFCPMLRIHGTGPHKPLWAFGDDTFKTLLTYNHLRYRLLPYIYSTSWQVTSNSASMMRPLLFDYWDDPNTYGIGDQYLFGPGLMVCPVTESAGGSMVIVPPASLLDSNGTPGGLSAVYYQGMEFEKEVVTRVDPSVDFNWDKVKREGVGANPRTDPVPGLVMDKFTARWEGFIQTQQAGKYTFRLRADDGMRMWVNDQPLVDDWTPGKAVTRNVPIELPANTRVPIKIEYRQDTRAAFIELRWLLPATAQQQQFTRKVYLPAGQWFDFWTGKPIAGGKTIDAAAPIERLPLYVKAGTILPLGPVVQYANEQPNAPLELRIYRGAKGAFTLYDDAGDGYGYENGERATIPIAWDEASQTLTIGKREGSYPGMQGERTFNVVWISEGHAVGDSPAKSFDAVVQYKGDAVNLSPKAADSGSTVEPADPSAPLRWTNPIVPQRADPQVFLHTDGWYYLTATVPEYDRIELRRARTLGGLSTAEAKVIWRKHDRGPMGAHIWAPEIHFIDGKWYVYFTAGAAENKWAIRPYVLECAGPDPLTDDWIERGRIKLGWDSFSLDGTTFAHRGVRYFVWAQAENGVKGTNIYLSRMDTPLSITGKIALLARPDHEWERRGPAVCEAPAVLIKNGRVFITYSASATDAKYCIGLIYADEMADLLDSASWTKLPQPVLKTNPAASVFGPGHNSFTTTPDGKTDILVYHARNYEKIKGDSLQNPDRATRAQVIRWREDGFPDFGDPVPDGDYQIPK